MEILQQENARLTAEVSDLTEQLALVRRQLDWFKRHLFGCKSERRLKFDAVEQAGLFAALSLGPAPSARFFTEAVRPSQAQGERYRQPEQKPGHAHLVDQFMPVKQPSRQC